MGDRIIPSGMTRIEPQHRDLELSRVYGIAAQALFKRPVTALFIAALTIYLPNLAIAHHIPAASPAAFSVQGIIWWFSMLVPMTSGAVFQAWITFQTPLPADAPKPTAVLTRLIPILAAGFLIGVGSLLGLALLVVPGILWGLAMTVAIPALVIERLGPIGAINRSSNLTWNRWLAIFGFSILVVLPFVVANTVAEYTLVNWNIAFDPASQSPFIARVMRPITDTIIAVLTAALGAAFYSELVRLKMRDFDTSPYVQEPS